MRFVPREGAFCSNECRDEWSIGEIREQALELLKHGIRWDRLLYALRSAVLVNMVERGNIKAVSEAIGVSRKTLHEWKKEFLV